MNTANIPVYGNNAAYGIITLSGCLKIDYTLLIVNTLTL